MKSRSAKKYWMLSSALSVAVLWSGVASATLGEPETSVAAESQLSRASIKESDRGTYRFHEIELPSGTVVREYAALDGHVFAVTWHGPFMPNLKQMLGRYFDEYAAAAQGNRANHGDRNHLQVRQSDLIVQAGGHMRAYRGRAYLPQALPSGVSAGDLE
jgi:Protein of unknown function (DUF2844)